MLYLTALVSVILGNTYSRLNTTVGQEICFSLAHSVTLLYVRTSTTNVHRLETYAYHKRTPTTSLRLPQAYAYHKLTSTRNIQITQFTDVWIQNLYNMTKIKYFLWRTEECVLTINKIKYTQITEYWCTDGNVYAEESRDFRRLLWWLDKHLMEAMELISFRWESAVGRLDPVPRPSVVVRRASPPFLCKWIARLK